MKDFITCWIFNEDLVHNVVLIALYSWILFQLCVLAYKILKKETKEKKSSYFIRRLIIFLFTYFIFGELIFLLLRKSFFNNWILSGWFMQDIVLYIIYTVMLVSIVMFLIKRIKKNKTEEKSVLNSIWTVILILFTEFLIGSFFLIVFNGALSNITLELESPTVVVEEGNKTLAINKMRMVLPNGVENGITTNVVKFTLVAVDLENGRKSWTRLSGWQEYIIGESSNGILAINNKKEKLYFIDPQTGKIALTEKEWVKNFPELKDNLSYNETDYYLASESELYLYALDGKYYKVDLVNNTLTQNPEYSAILSEKFYYSNHISGLSEEDTQWVTEAINTYYSDLMNVSILWAEDKSEALIAYQQKRNDEKLTVSMVSLIEENIKWTTSINYNSSAMMGNAISISEKDGSFFIVSDGNLYKIEEDSGNMDFIYQYRWNRVK